MNLRRNRDSNVGATGLSRIGQGCWTVALTLLFAWVATGCVTVEFLAQAATGQWQIGKQARPIEEVLADPKTSSRTHAMLREVLRAKAYGAAHGLSMHANYESFSDLKRQYVVWFVNASRPLAFEPRTYTFPIVGSFPGLGWFDEASAEAFAADLREAGWDVNIRGVSAFSTGGWFDDPIVSSMFIDHPAQTGLIVNLILHESLHATVLVQNQQYFNESLASFVADTLTPYYLAEYYGPESREFYEYRRAVADFKKRSAAMRWAFDHLKQAYSADLSDAQKAAFKAEVMAWLANQVHFDAPPNNATLIGFQLYQEGNEEFPMLLAACASNWQQFLHAFQGLSGNHFDAAQTPEIGPVIERIARNHCQPLAPIVPPRALSPQLRRHGVSHAH